MRKIILIVSILFIAGIIGIVNAQEALPTGGDSFETAVEIKQGSYEGGAMKKDDSEYFYINVKPGQEIKIEGTFKALSDSAGEEYLTLYDEDRKKLTEIGATLDKGQQETFLFVWLSNADKDLHKYYIKRECTWIKVASHPLNISLIDRYDAGSQTDAGDTVEKAINVTLGEYKGYLSGKAGADTKDFYKIAVKKGQTLTTRVTPPSEATMKVTVYDKDRRVLKDEYASNPGAIVTNSLKIAKSGDVFIAAICDRYCSKNLVAYTMNITTEGVAVDDDDDGGAVIDTGKDTTKDEAEKKGLNLGLIIGIIILIIIIAVVAYLLLKKKKQ